MVSERCRQRASRGKCGCRSLVGGDPPPARRGLVDRSSHEWVSKPEPTGDICNPDKVETQKLIDGLDRRCLVNAGGRRRQLGLERVSCYGSALENKALPAGEQAELLRERSSDASGNARSSNRDLGAIEGRATQVSCTGELLQVERISAALGVEQLRICIPIGGRVQ